MRQNSIAYYRDLLWVLFRKELHVRYRSTVFGYAWSVLNPLAFATAFYVLFKVFARIKVENYALLLICGLFPWQWFQNSVAAANLAFLDNASLIKKVRFPRHFLVTSGAMNDLFHFAASLPVIVAFLLWYGGAPSWHWVYQVPLMLALQLAFTYGLALFVATCNLFFRDLERLTGIALLLWMYVTPVLIPADMVPERFRWVLGLNPMAAIVTNWHNVFLRGDLDWDLCLRAAGFAVISMAVGCGVYRRLERRFAEIV